MFPVEPYAILSLLISVIGAHFRRSFIKVDSSVVPDMLINLLLDLSTFYSQCSPRICWYQFSGLQCHVIL
jgi:hypothetical protein